MPIFSYRYRFHVIVCTILIALGGTPVSLWAQFIPQNSSEQSAPREQPAFFVEIPATDANLWDKLIPNSVSDPNHPALTYGRTSLPIQQALKPLAEKLAGSIVKIIGEHGHPLLGTIVSDDGLVVAKHSELPPRFRCMLDTGESFRGTLIGIQRQNDLALIQIEATGLTPIVFDQTTLQPVNPGDLVVSIGANRNAIGLGMVSVPPQTFKFAPAKCSDCVDLGATVTQLPEVVTSQPETGTSQISGLEVSRVYPRTTAERIGLLVGDVLQSINGQPLASGDQLNEIAKTLRIGQLLTLEIVRDHQPKTLSTTIKRTSQQTTHDQWGGGPFSGRRFGFGTVIAHDSVIAPDACGSPLIDLNGKVVGINIARSLRVATFAIPLADVYRFIKYVRPNTNLVIE
jgi:serine protease Do